MKDIGDQKKRDKFSCVCTCCRRSKAQQFEMTIAADKYGSYCKNERNKNNMVIDINFF